MRERRDNPEDRLLADTMTGKSSDVKFAIARGRAFGRGYWFGYGSATLCALIWVALDLYSTGRLGSWGL